ncbi:MAG: hypothetical protein KAU28_07285 [Phycisphaerae bacterium]|nr:hypothetical protein [Phycisphaerae bacterium]
MGVNSGNLPVALEVLFKALGLSILIFLAGVVVWIVGKHYVWQLRRGVARRSARRKRTRPDGLPYPPTGMGICSECEKAGLEVFHLPSGRRLCKDCYARIEGSSTKSSTNNAAGSRT